MMKTTFFSGIRASGLVLSGVLFFTAAGGERVVAKDITELDIEIRKSIDYLDLLQADPAKAIPSQVLRNAEGIIIMREYKAGFVIGLKGGRGVALVKDLETGQWSPPAFIKSGEGSFGWQIGGSKSDSVVLLMDKRGMAVLNQGAMKLGVDLSASAGPVAAGGQVNLDNLRDPVLVYSNTKGLYAGASIQTGGVVADEKGNAKYYGMSMPQVHLSGKARMTPTGKALVDRLVKYSQ